ncbi:hypothetical protein B0H14DRAFT_3111945 [Mycena olivaceomarginata]|nr:hypothetical protein B0H14DRAFT_3111945 [Mycena olivaceomarginata]
MVSLPGEYCHQKPKHGTHSYCSKTCAAQTASTLCNYCQKKPKFQNFDYCGKNCAALAAAGTPPAAAGNRAAKNPAPAQKPAVRSGGNVPTAGAQAPAGGANSLMDPVQLASTHSLLQSSILILCVNSIEINRRCTELVAQHLPKVAAVAQHIPQVQSFLAAVAPAQALAQAAPPPANGTANPMPAPPPAPVATTNPQPKQPRNNPFLKRSQTALAQRQRAGPPLLRQQLRTPPKPRRRCSPGTASSRVRAARARRLIRRDERLLFHEASRRGCLAGLVPPCIMCLTRPAERYGLFLWKGLQGGGDEQVAVM